MTQNPQTPTGSGATTPRRGRGWWWKIALLILIAGAGTALLRGKGETKSNGTSYIAQRGVLPIEVLVSGNVEALESQDIKSEVKAKTKIMSIVEEGYLVTPEDVKNKKILVTLNDSELQDKLTQQEIEVQNAFSQYTDAREQYEIQVKQNESDIKAAELEAKFKRMDFEKYLGKELAQQIIDKLGITELEKEAHVDLNELYAEIRQNAEALDARNGGEDKEDGNEAQSAADDKAKDGSGEADSEATNSDDSGGDLITLALQADKSARAGIDFSEYAKPELLKDGDSEQKLRQLEDDLLISKNELTQAESQLEGTQRLAEKGFVTQNDLDKDKISLERSRIKVESSETARRLFITYEFPKEAEKRLSDYQESLRKLVRTKKQALSKLSQSETGMLARKIQFDLKQKQRDEIQEQIDKCKVPAERVGLVVYGMQKRRPWDQSPPIQVGTEVWEGFQILTIPDMTSMSVSVNIDESEIKKIKKGQRVRVTVEAFPGKELEGEVTKVAVLPDSGRSWLNADQKMYPVTITIDGTHDWLKPGMTAQAEILIDNLDDVVYVPLQAVSGEAQERVCYVEDGLGAPKRKVVETGQFNDKFVEIKSGLSEGDRVLLRAPEGSGGKSDKANPEEEKSPETPSQEVAKG